MSNLIDFNFDVLRCYNLVLCKKILIHNIGFYCLFSMFILQIIFFIIYLIKKLKPLKNFMLIFKINNNNINNIQNNRNINNLKISKNRIKSTPPSKNKYSSAKNENKDNKKNKKKNYIKKIFIKKKKKLIDKKQNTLNLQKIIKSEDDPDKTFITTNNYVPKINIRKPIVNNNEKIYNIKLNKQ